MLSVRVGGRLALLAVVLALEFVLLEAGMRIPLMLHLVHVVPQRLFLPLLRKVHVLPHPRQVTRRPEPHARRGTSALPEQELAEPVAHTHLVRVSSPAAAARPAVRNHPEGPHLPVGLPHRHGDRLRVDIRLNPAHLAHSRRLSHVTLRWVFHKLAA